MGGQAGRRADGQPGRPSRQTIKQAKVSITQVARTCPVSCFKWKIGGQKLQLIEGNYEAQKCVKSVDISKILRYVPKNLA